jgi:hypothetical protein
MTGGKPKTDPAKLENARILYENSDKTAAEVCEISGVGRRRFFARIVEKWNESAKLKFSRSMWLDNAESPALRGCLPRFCMLSLFQQSLQDFTWAAFFHLFFKRASLSTVTAGPTQKPT